MEFETWSDYFKWLMANPNSRISFGGWDWNVKKKSKTSIILSSELGREKFILIITKTEISALYFSIESVRTWKLKNPTFDVIFDWLQGVAMECAL